MMRFYYILAIITAFSTANGQKIRPLSEINTSKAESYPYINATGTRIYFLRGEVNNTKVYQSEWNASTERFETNTKVVYDKYLDVISFSISEDEKTMYIIYNDVGLAQAIILRRNTFQDQFVYTKIDGSDVINLSLPNSITGDHFFTSGLCFSKDSKYAYIYHNNSKSYTSTYWGDPNRTFIVSQNYPYLLAFKMTGNVGQFAGILGQFDFNAGYNTMTGYKYYSGQTSKGIATSTNLAELDISYTGSDGSGAHDLAHITQPNILPWASKITFDKKLIPNNGYGNGFIQPSITQDRKKMVFVVSDGDWNSNDLYFYDLSPTTSLLREEQEYGSENDIYSDVLNNTNIISNNVVIYPNPSINNFTVQLNVGEKVASGQFYLYDMQGQKVRQHEFNSSNENFVIDIQDLPNGLYLATVNSEGKTVEKRNVLIAK